MEYTNARKKVIIKIGRVLLVIAAIALLIFGCEG